MGEMVEIWVEAPPVVPTAAAVVPIDKNCNDGAICTNTPAHDEYNYSQEEAWLPITESRNGNFWTSAFHLISSGIGFQALSLPFAFAALGWFWGTLCLAVAYVWQLYTIWILVHLHESVPGTRHSRYLFLSIAAFGEKLGKLLAIFPVLYLSGGACVTLIITGGGMMELFYNAVCGDSEAACNAKELSGAEWYLVFICLAIWLAFLCPNLNSVAIVSLVGAITAIGYCTLIWAFSIHKGRPDGVSYDPSKAYPTDMSRFRGVLNGLGIIALAFRGHNVVLEIQGTIPSISKHQSQKKMWRAVTVSYLLIAICLFPLAIAGFWAYGNMIPANGGLVSAFSKFHQNSTSRFVMGLIYMLVVIHCLSAFQVYAMVTFDNLERGYISRKKKKCSMWVPSVIRVFFGGLTYFIAVALPFLSSLAGITGGIALPLTYAYPCFMWIAIKKPRRNGAMWCLNLALGCLAVVISISLVGGAVWNLVNTGLDANFFNPR